jgi:uncharacterized repeat protein (TIGR02543 family)
MKCERRFGRGPNHDAGHRLSRALGLVTVTLALGLIASPARASLPYQVTLDSEGGSSCPPFQVTAQSPYGTNLPGFALCSPTRNGFVFGGWFDGDNGTGEQIEAATIVTRVAPHTLFAKWSPLFPTGNLLKNPGLESGELAPWVTGGAFPFSVFTGDFRSLPLAASCGFGSYPNRDGGCTPFAPGTALTVNATVDLTTFISPGRSHPDQVFYRVSSISCAEIQLPVAPAGIVAGDEVLVINLMGTPSDNGRVGAHEFGVVEAVGATSLTLVRPLTESYSNAGNANLSSQVVRVIRVPHYSSLSITSTGVLTTSAFGDANIGTGVIGSGLVAFHVDDTLNIAAGGRITVDALGYPGGAPGLSNFGNGNINTYGFPGTGLAGPPAGRSLEQNTGGGGGGRSFTCGTSGDCASTGGGGGHATAGGAGMGELAGSPGVGGVAYASSGGDRLYLGSGGGGGGADANNAGGDSCNGTPGGAGGGILHVRAKTIINSGSMSARGALAGTNPCGTAEEGAGGAGAGGTLVVFGASNLGSVAASGGGRPACDRCGGIGGEGRLLQTPPARAADPLACGYVIKPTEGTRWLRGDGAAGAGPSPDGHRGTVSQVVDVHDYVVNSGSLQVSFGGDAFAVSNQSPPSDSTDASFSVEFLDAGGTVLGSVTSSRALSPQATSPEFGLDKHFVAPVPPGTSQVRFVANAFDKTAAATHHGFDDLLLELRPCAGANCFEPTCSDGFQNQGEAGVDCGGPCALCEVGTLCTTDSICASDFCNSLGVCAIPACTPTSCDDGNLCTTETCDRETGCQRTNLSGLTCSDVNDCTEPDTCDAGVCKGVPLERPGCYGKFAGPPVIGPPIEKILISDGATFSLDLTSFENDFEDGPPAPVDGLTWSAEFDPGLFIVNIDPATDVLEVTPVDPDFPFDDQPIRLTLTDSDGQTDVQVVNVSHEVSEYVVTLEASPNPALPGGSRVVVTATLKSPTGRELGDRALLFTVTGGGTVLRPNVATDEDGVAKTLLLTGPASEPHVIRAQYTSPLGSFGGETTLVVEPAEFDAGISILDLGFFTLEGESIIPGPTNPLSRGVPVELRANVRNLGRSPTPALEVLFRHTVLASMPPSLGDAEPLGTVRTTVIPAGELFTAALEGVFDEEGFHLLDVIVDPNGEFTEFNEGNNRATQGFRVGVVEPGGGDGDEEEPPISLSCELTGSELSANGVPGVDPKELLKLRGRADYTALIALDETRELGLAGVRGGVVSIAILDADGQEVTVGTPPRELVPASGDDSRFGGLRTIAESEEPVHIGQFPSRSPDDEWDVRAPSEIGCYTLVTCVSDGVTDGCCEKPFCVTPNGPKLSCETPSTPVVGGFSTPPEIGVDTSLSTYITNNGDFDAIDVKARLVIDGVQIGPTIDLDPMATEDVVGAAFPWIPQCGAKSATIELQWISAYPGQTEIRTAKCSTRMPDLRATRLSVTSNSGCDYRVEVQKSLAQTAMVPALASAATFRIERPDGVTDVLDGPVGLKTSALNYQFEKAGTYIVSALVDGPIEGGLCGEAPESDEAVNNVISRELCADPSPWKSANSAGSDALEITPWPVVYGQPATVTARLYNHGTLPINEPVEALLTSRVGRVLDTDQSDDLIRLEASCGAPIMPGQSRELKWRWTPRYPTDGGAEVRDVQVVIDPQQLYPICAEGRENNVVDEALTMNLFHTFKTSDVMQLGQPIEFEVDVMSSGTLRPNDEGSLVRFEVFRDGGELSHGAEAAIIAPGGADSPDQHRFTWTPTADDCKQTLPLKYVQTIVDHNEKYLETSEGDNDRFLKLPDLVPTKLEQVTEGCQSRVILTVEDKSEGARIKAGRWSGKITIEDPEGSLTTIPFEGLEGDGVFDVSDLTNLRFPATAPGTYRYVVEIDTASSSLCGDILESNERNNRLEGTWVLCPDPAVSDSALKPRTRVQRGRVTTFEGTIRNAGGLSIIRNFPVQLGTRDGLLVNLPQPGVGVEASCAAPIEPGETVTVTWDVDLSNQDPVDLLVMTVDPMDVMPEECRQNNNRAERFLYLDLSPHRSVRGPDYNGVPDISSAAFPAWRETSIANYTIRAFGPEPGQRNPKRETIKSPIQVYPGVDEMTLSHVFHRKRGPPEVFGTRPLDALAEHYPKSYPMEMIFDGARCDPNNPIVAVGVRVDHERRVTESLETNQNSRRDLGNLKVSSVTRSTVENDRFKLKYRATGSNYDEFRIGEWKASASVTPPDGVVRVLELAPQTGPYKGCKTCDVAGSAADIITHPTPVEATLNGFYKATVTADPSRADAPCGDIPERDELDNQSREMEWAICPELSVFVVATPPKLGPNVPLDTPWDVEVTVRNLGARPLVEAIEVSLEEWDGNNLPFRPFLAPPQTHHFTRDEPLGVEEEFSFQFEWKSYVPGPPVSRLAARVKVLDTDESNGGLEFALCSGAGSTKRSGYERVGSTRVCASCHGLCIDCEKPEKPPELGCVLAVNDVSLEACGEGRLSFSVSRPGGGETVDEDDMDSFDPKIISVDAEGVRSDLEPNFAYSDGRWTTAVDLQDATVGGSVGLFVTANLTDGSACRGERAFIVGGGKPDLELSPDNIEFLSLDGDETPFTGASVGQIAKMKLSVTNGEKSCGAVGLFGKAYIDLGPIFGRIDLGQWTLASIGGDTTETVTLVPSPDAAQVPDVQGDGSFLWDVTLPSPWVHLVTLVVEDIDGGPPLVTSRALNVGMDLLPGETPAVSVDFLDPEPGLLVREEEQTFRLRVQRNETGGGGGEEPPLDGGEEPPLDGDGGDEEDEDLFFLEDLPLGAGPITRTDLLELRVFMTDDEGGILATFDALASPESEVGGGEFEVRFNTRDVTSTGIALMVRVALVDGQTGVGKAEFTFDESCEANPEGDCTECIDGDGDGYPLPSDTCSEGIDCNDTNPASTTTDNDGDCDGFEFFDDCDDEDPNSTGLSTDGDCDGVETLDDCDDTDDTSTVVANDGDCDEVETLDDCDDTDEMSTVVANDEDCDGVETLDDCDDTDEMSTVVANDGDCDGVETLDDCDDTDEMSTVVANDGDCDGVETLDDCDDTDEMSTVVANDEDCDGVETFDDCDDTDEMSTVVANDEDCDGVETLDDCDDTNPASTVVANDEDCDGVETLDDCDDTDEMSTVVANDGDCDGVETFDDCDDTDPTSTIVVDDGDCDGVETFDDCDDMDEMSTVVAADGDCDGVETAEDCDDTDPMSTTLESDADCDGVEPPEDCDDFDPEVSDLCLPECGEDGPTIELHVVSAAFTAEDCSIDAPRFELTLGNDGEEFAAGSVQISIFDSEPSLDAVPVATVMLEEMILLEGELPIAPFESATFEVVLPTASTEVSELYVVVNHAAETAFTEVDGVVRTVGAERECTLDDNIDGPFTCESQPLAECLADEDCGSASDRCDVMTCEEGLCYEQDSGSDWLPCASDEVVYVEFFRGDEIGYATCRHVQGNELEGAVECETDDDGELVIRTAPEDLLCGAEDE